MDSQRNTFGWPCWVSPPSRTSLRVTRFLISQIFFIQLILRTYLIPNLSDSEPVRFWIYLIPNLSDSKPGWFQAYLILKTIWFRTYLSPNLSDFEPIWFGTYLITNSIEILNLSDTNSEACLGLSSIVSPSISLSLQSWAGRQPLLPFPVAKLAIKQVNPGPNRSTHVPSPPPSSQWLPTLLAPPAAKLGTKQVNSSPLSPSQLTMISYWYLKTQYLISLVSDKFGIWISVVFSNIKWQISCLAAICSNIFGCESVAYNTTQHCYRI